MSASSKPRPYRYVEQGCGGILTFAKPATREEEEDPMVPKTSIPFVGTSECETCVGVYLEINDTQCFVAHIDVCIVLRGRKGIVHNPNGAEILQIAAWLKGALDQELTKPTERMRDTLVMVCPHPYSDNYENVRQVGQYVMNTITEWLGLSVTAKPPTLSSGFVTEFPGGDLVLFTHDEIRHRELRSPEEEGWTRYWEGLGNKWTKVIFRDE